MFSLTDYVGGSDAAVAQLTWRNCRIGPSSLSALARTQRKSLKKRPEAKQCAVRVEEHPFAEIQANIQARIFSNSASADLARADFFCAPGVGDEGDTRRPITCCLKSWHVVVIARDIKQ